MCMTESLCCTTDIKHNIVNQLYFNKVKKKLARLQAPSLKHCVTGRSGSCGTPSAAHHPAVSALPARPSSSSQSNRMLTQVERAAAAGPYLPCPPRSPLQA